MEVKRVYKLREGKSLNSIKEMFSDCVYAIDAIRNPLENEGEIMHVAYEYINVDTMQPTNQVLGLEMLTVDQFEDHFELYMDVGEISEKLRELSGDDS